MSSAWPAVGPAFSTNTQMPLTASQTKSLRGSKSDHATVPVRRRRMGVNKGRVALWAEALESGDYTQGEGVLHAVYDGVDKYCCLGVACEVAFAHGVPRQEITGRGYLPWVVSSWYELPSRNPYVGQQLTADDVGEVDARPVTAANANDSLKWDFKRIARGIRDTYVEAHDSEMS